MPRYIDADAMIRKICGMKCGCERYECGYDEAGCPKVRDLETAPTVSPDEVRGFGKWIVKQTAIGKDYTICSVCKTDFKFKTDKGTLARLDMRGMAYCPQCGARMEVTSDD